MTGVASPADGFVRVGTATGRWVLVATTVASTMAFVDATVVNVALPALGAELGATVAGLQWTLNGYLLALAALILLGGSLGDRYGRRRVFVFGSVWFTAASLLCGLAPTTATLVAARVLQGVGGALLTPASLAIIEASFHPDERSRAIGFWSGWSGVGVAVGPFIGGWLIDVASWRWVFLLNLPLAVAVVVAARHVPETSDPMATGSVDGAGALLAIGGLGGLTFALIEGPTQGASPLVLALGVAGAMMLTAFLIVEARRPSPLLPLELFASRTFTATNLVTFALYAAISGSLFLLLVHLQQVLGYSALEAGAAVLPITALLLVLSAPAGRLVQRLGPRVPLTVGPWAVATGLALLATVDTGAAYLSRVLPAVTLFGLGLAAAVAPLTATVLAAVDPRHVGVASAVNNAVARVAGLVAVALLPAAAGLSGDDYRDPAAFATGYEEAIWMATALAGGAGLLAWLTIPGEPPPTDLAVTEPQCPLDAPPLRTAAP
ncbi:MAG: MFS transporter [Nitriliruptorales bacterium]